MNFLNLHMNKKEKKRVWAWLNMRAGQILHSRILLLIPINTLSYELNFARHMTDRMEETTYYG